MLMLMIIFFISGLRLEIKSIPLTKSLMESFLNVKMENFEIYTDGAGDYLKVDIVKKVEYFQFPQDEDMEV